MERLLRVLRSGGGDTHQAARKREPSPIDVSKLPSDSGALKPKSPRSSHRITGLINVAFISKALTRIIPSGMSRHRRETEVKAALSSTLRAWELNPSRGQNVRPHLST